MEDDMDPHSATDDSSVSTDLDALLRPPEAAQLLSVTTSTLDAWRLRGQGPRFVRVSRRCVRYRRRDLLEWTKGLLHPSENDGNHAA